MGPLQGNHEDLLLRWDELSQSELAQLARDPRTSAQLEHLQTAERWLESAAPAAGPCPSSEDLYDLGRGPGAAPLSDARLATLTSHLERCAPCHELTQTLKSTPPVPLETVPEPAPILPMRSATQFGSRRFAAPLAAAAAVLAIFGAWKFSSAPSGADVLAALPGGFPESPLLRGGASELAFPRGVVLERGGEALPTWARELNFEIRPSVDADSYRVEIRRQAGDAFSAGDTIGELTSATSVLAANAELLDELTPGRYTWEAWSFRNGLERRLGARDFEVRDSGSVWTMLETANEAEDQLDARAVRYLHELGLVTDAQRLAASLPASPERDAYLATILR